MEEECVIYTVLIAEDELLVRMGIESSVPWLQMDMRVVAETADGMAAWEAFGKFHPDIVIADIRMPKMDGVELLERIRTVDPDCAVILVTNVESGCMLEKAKALGIVDILFKASMKRDHIEAAVALARDSLPDNRGQAIAPKDDREVWREYLTRPRQKADSSLVDETAPPSALFRPHGFVYFAIRPSERLSHHLADSLTNLFEHRMSAEGDFCMVNLERGTVALAKTPFDARHAEKQLSDLGDYVLHNFVEALCFVVQPEETELPALCRQLDHAAFYASDEHFFDQPTLFLDPSGWPRLAELSQAARTLRRCAPLMKRDVGLSQCADDLAALPKAMASGWSEGNHLGRRILERMGSPANCNGIHELADEIARAAERAAAEVRLSARPEILAAIDYMDEHISEKLTVTGVSDIIGYHPAYFSNLFKRELGLSYSDFLTNLRINRAKEMMRESSRSLGEVAESCGFSDLSYFSVKFKRVVGVAPNQWRAKL